MDSSGMLREEAMLRSQMSALTSVTDDHCALPCSGSLAGVYDGMQRWGVSQMPLVLTA